MRTVDKSSDGAKTARKHGDGKDGFLDKHEIWQPTDYLKEKYKKADFDREYGHPG